MDSIKSFKGYGKVDPQEEAAFKRKTRKRLIIIVVSLILLAAIIIGVVAGTVAHKKNKNDSDDIVPSASKSPAQSIKAVCSVTRYPDSCFSSISSVEESNTTDPEKIFQVSLKVALGAMEKIATLPDEWMKKTDDPFVQQALKICRVVFDDAADSLNDTISSMDVAGDEKLLSVSKIGDLRTWMSTSLTDLETCLDALLEVNATITDDIKLLIKDPTEFASNSLAIGSKILSILSNFKVPIHRRLLGFPAVTNSGFPEWVRAADRRMLIDEINPKPDVTVAKDGTGDVKSINEAVKRIPAKSKSRFVIYVKAGLYEETVLMDKTLWNVMIYGDGQGKTVIAAGKNFIDGTRTFETATFAVVGRNFLAKDITFQNTAGAAKHQAVAVRCGSDHSVFYRCTFDGFQDTLYAHSNRQFYRECDITGTVDFIFGNAAVVFQNCKILPRQPLPNQFVTITAQGKKDPNMNTGISIHNSILAPLDALTADTYLGRPWKDFSTTVIMQSQIGGFLNPAGWIAWNFTTGPPSTLFYAEYQNTGPGANLEKRVNWTGYKPTLTPTQAAMFTVKSFIEGDNWLPATKITFT